MYLKRDVLNIIFTPWVKASSSSWSLGYLRQSVHLFIDSLRIVIFLMRRQRRLESEDRVIQVPIFGQFGIPAHRGFKVFDLNNGVVGKVFDSDVPLPSIANEIEGLKKASHFDFAPTLKSWNVEERWHEEEYVSATSNESSHRRLDSEIVLKKFRDEVAPCLKSLILFQKPEVRNLKEFIDETVQVVEMSPLASNGQTISEFREIKSFLDSMIQRVSSREKHFIYLVFTHGDFCPANMVNTRSGIRVLDWEGAKCRSVLFDFYSYFFYRPVSLKIPVDNIVPEIEGALPFVTSMLVKDRPTIVESLRSLHDDYRWVYYIEQICSEMQREMTDKNLPILDYILRYIEAFNQYEMLIADTNVVSSLEVEKDSMPS